MERISAKLGVLRAEEISLKEEMDSNEELGRHITILVESRAKSNEYHKYKLHVEEIDKITSLLLGLSGRLARTENAISAMDHHTLTPLHEQKVTTSVHL